MGQTIEVKSVVLGGIALFDTDRSITGQDGHRFESRAETQDNPTTAGRLAAELFGSDVAVDHVFVQSNQVTVRRTDGWSDESAVDAATVIRDFFVFYEENRGVSEVSND
jgi:hypothetical protein